VTVGLYDLMAIAAGRRLKPATGLAQSPIKAFAIGILTDRGFRVRTIRWSKAAARRERCLGEEIRRASIKIEGNHRYAKRSR
jgi:hypothetical protein